MKDNRMDVAFSYQKINRKDAVLDKRLNDDDVIVHCCLFVVRGRHTIIQRYTVVFTGEYLSLVFSSHDLTGHNQQIYPDIFCQYFVQRFFLFIFFSLLLIGRFPIAEMYEKEK